MSRAATDLAPVGGRRYAGGVDSSAPLLLALVAAAALVAVAALVLLRSYRRAGPGEVLVVHRPGTVAVVRGGGLVLPLLHRADALDLTAKTIVVERRGRAGVSCRDGVRADVVAHFVVRVRDTPEDIVRVATTLGCDVSLARLTELLAGRCEAGLRAVLRELDFDEAAADRERVADRVREVVGEDLGGLVLDAASLPGFEQTPVELLDPNDILDATGIRKLTEISAREQMRALEARREVALREAEHQLRVDELRLRAAAQVAEHERHLARLKER